MPLYYLAILKRAQLLAEADNQIIPLSYNYANQFSSKKNSQLVFNPEQQTVFDRLHSKEDLPLSKNSYDRLSFQAQLYLDVINSAEFSHKTYHLVDRNELKTYEVSKLAEETIITPLGTFTAIKFKQHRPGKDEYTLIWLAKDRDYFLLRVQRIAEGKKEYQINLKSALIDGKMLTAKRIKKAAISGFFYSHRETLGIQTLIIIHQNLCTLRARKFRWWCNTITQHFTYFGSR